MNASYLTCILLICICLVSQLILQTLGGEKSLREETADVKMIAEDTLHEIKKMFLAVQYKAHKLAKKVEALTTKPHKLKGIKIDILQGKAYDGVCVFDIDRTLTATQLGVCPNAIEYPQYLDKGYAHEPHIDHPRYANYPFPLHQGKNAIRALQICQEANFAISIATKGSGCTKEALNYEASKFEWIQHLYYNVTGVVMTGEDWTEDAKDVKAFQCGEFNKDKMLEKISQYWNISPDKLILYDDKPSNLQVMLTNEVTYNVKTVFVTPERNGTTCESLRDPCCGITKEEVYDGIKQVQALSLQ